MTGSAFTFAQRPSISCARAASGFTIVELLVVASIMAALFGLIVVGMRPTAGGELRRAAQQFASVLLAAQSRGIGDPKGAAVVLELDISAGPGGVQCLAAHAGDKQPFVVGTVTEGMPPAPGETFALVEIDTSNGGDLQKGYRVQFFGSDPTILLASAWFNFQPALPPEIEHIVSLRAANGQSYANTPWPERDDAEFRARVACYPAKGPLALLFAKTVGIDLRYSGTGDDPSSAWGGLASKGNLAVSFDSVGAIDALMQGVGSSTAASRQPLEPIYFLVAARADINGDTALASERSLWVAIQPQTGRVTTSANVAQSGKNNQAVRAARANARAALAAGK